LHKILTFVLPGPVSYVWIFFTQSLTELSFLKALNVPIIILVQIGIYKLLKRENYALMALEFKKWSLNSWIFFVIIFIVVFVLEAVLHRL
jgi:hypothetical protein